MDNDNKHTARYQLSRFLQSEESFLLPLNAADISILIIICDFMDTGNQECCFASQATISKISRVPLRTLMRHLKKLIKIKLLKCERKKYNNNYLLGDKLKLDMPPWHISSATMADVKCHGGTLYNNNYKNTYNKDVAHKQTRSELKQTAKEWGPGHPGWESIHKSDNKRQ